MKITTRSDRTIDSPTKVPYPLTLHLIDSLNGTANVTFEKTWGYYNPNTKIHNGMTGHVIRGEVDIGGTILFMTDERVGAMEFISMIAETKVLFVFRAPPLSYVSNIYYMPFDGSVWLYSSILVMIGSIIVYWTFATKLDNHKQEEVYPPSDMLLIAAGTVCQCDSEIKPKTISSKFSSVKIL